MKSSMYYYSNAKDIFVSACVEIAKGNWLSEEERMAVGLNNLGEYLIFLASNMAVTSYNEEGNPWDVEDFAEILKYLSVFFSGKDYLLDPYDDDEDDEDDDEPVDKHNTEDLEAFINSYNDKNSLIHSIEEKKKKKSIIDPKKK